MGACVTGTSVVGACVLGVVVSAPELGLENSSLPQLAKTVVLASMRATEMYLVIESLFTTPS